MIRRSMTALAPAAFAAVTLITSAPVRADDVKLPPTMAVTAYDTGTAGFNIAVGVGKMMKDKYGTDVRVLPAGNDVARLAPLRAKRAIAMATPAPTRRMLCRMMVEMTSARRRRSRSQSKYRKQPHAK